MTNSFQTRTFRIGLPIILILVWLGVASIGGPTFGKLSTVATNDQAGFLPATADSTKVQALAKKFSTNNTLPAIVVINSPQPLFAPNTPPDQQATARVPFITLAQTIASSAGLARTSVAGPIFSQDGKAVEYIVPIKGKTLDIVKKLQTTVDTSVSGTQKGYVTGPAGLAAALISSFKGIDGVLVYVALIAVFVILLIVYRSIVLPFLVLITATFGLSAAGLVVYHAVTGGLLKLNGQSQGILSILAIGAATDYSLLLIARYREALHQYQRPWDAMTHAFQRSLEPITASAATVIVGVLCLLLSELNSNKDLGPVAALGIAFSYLAAVSFLPAVMVLLGRKAFWPFVPQYTGAASEPLADFSTGRGSIWQRIPGLIAARPRAIWLVCLIVLGGFALAATQFKADGLSQTDSILGASAAVTGEKVAAAHFAAGSGSPAQIIVRSDKLPAVLSAIKASSYVTTAEAYADKPSQFFALSSYPPKIVDNQSLITATLNVAADSNAGQQAVIDLRTRLKSVDRTALVGGTSAIVLDSNTAASRDLRTIIPVVLVVILIILMFLLRSILAPVLLILSVILSFAATIGISALLFNHVFHFAGSDPAIPLFGFIFLVALGVDYNIFLMTRVREESKHRGTRPGVLFGLSVTGSVITSAGVVLAATFAALAVVPVLFLVQIAFIVAFGVLLDTIIVRSLLIPALGYDIGRHLWWPSQLGHEKQ